MNAYFETAPAKPVLWAIDCGGGNYWSDDRGGHLFVSEAMAMKTFAKYADALHRIDAAIKPTLLDDDLAQMGDLYHEK